MGYIKRKSQKIPLSQGKYALVDVNDYVYLMQWKWYYNKGYACRTIIVNGKKSMIYMHRAIMQAPSNLVVDHRNSNTLNNCKYNLRLCTHQDNMRNTKAKSRKTSKYRGVSWNKKRSKWEAQIKIGKGRKKFLGYFSVEEDAGIAYNNAVLKYHGEFGVLNYELYKKKVKGSRSKNS